MGGADADSGLLSPISTTTTGDSPLATPTYLFLHQEEVLTSFDIMCPGAIVHEHPFVPNLPTLQVIPDLMVCFRRVEKKADALIEAVQQLQKDSRRRGTKRAPHGAAGGNDAN